MSIACVGACGNGFQVCNEMGSGYSECQCFGGGFADAGVNPTMDTGTMVEQDAGTSPITDDSGAMMPDDAGTNTTNDAGVGQDVGTSEMMDATSGGVDASTTVDAGSMMNTDAGVAGTGPCLDLWCTGSSSSPGDAGVCLTNHSRFWPTLDHVGGAARLQRSSTVLGEPTVYDQYTTIEWTGCPAGTTGTHCSNGTPQDGTATVLTATCENLLWGGHSDWVAPTPEMVLSIQDVTKAPSSMDSANFPRATSPIISVSVGAYGLRVFTEPFVASTPSSNADGVQYCVRFPQGVDLREPITRCYDTTYNQSAEPTTYDRATNLTWQTCPYGGSGPDCSSGGVTRLNWEQAKNYCEGLNWAGQTDWTLPTMEQIRSLTNYKERTVPFSQSILSYASYEYWTKTFEPGSGYVRPYTMLNSYTPATQITSTKYVRCVRENGVFDRPVIYPSTSCREVTKTYFHADFQSTMPRFSRILTMPGEPVVRDDFVNIEWTGCTVGVTGDSCASGTPTSINYLNLDTTCETLNWGGHSDWTVPSAAVLRSLPDFNTEAWHADVTAAFPNLTSTALGSSSQQLTSPGRLTVRATGRSTNSNSSTALLCVRDPAGGSLPSTVTQCLNTTTWNTNEPIVSDMANGVDWMGCLAGQNGRACLQGGATRYTYSASESYCDNLNWAGQSDWRLPTLYELGRVLDAKSNMVYGWDPFAFSDHNSSVKSLSGIWSSTLSLSNTSWFYSGNVLYTNTLTDRNYLKCIRDR